MPSLTSLTRRATRALRRIALPQIDSAATAPSGPVPRVDDLQLHAGATVLDPVAIFQPPSAHVDACGHIDWKDKTNIRHISDKSILYKGMPYSQYLSEWQFHPGRIAGYLATQPIDPDLLALARRVLELCVELPNGGLALYYPKTISAARLQSNDYIYSGIAQGQLLAAFTRLMKAPEAGDPAEWREAARRVALSMQFPFEKGGVCLDGNAILEVPNFRSCPEIVLNGWTDALIRLHDYLETALDGEFAEFYERNLAALAQLLPSFDAPDAQLSRYSNLCPYVFRAHLGRTSRDVPRVIVEYSPHMSGWNAYRIDPLRSGEGLRPCAYDNRIEREARSSIDLRLSASGLHDLRIHVEAECSHLSFDPGTFDKTTTIPAPTRQTRVMAPASRSGDFTTFIIKPGELGLLAGCPTNFMKNGRENYYHVYHVVALYLLALTARDPAQREALANVAQRWESYIESDLHKRLGTEAVLSKPQKFLKRMNRLRAVAGPSKFKVLKKMALTRPNRTVKAPA